MDILNIEKVAKENGADLVGFCKLDKEYYGFNYGISIAVKLPDSILKTIEDRPTMCYFHTYRTANALLDRIAFLVSREVEKQGYNAFMVGASQSTPSEKEQYKGLFSHKQTARLSGLGFIGKSGLFISTKYGSKVRLITILTDMPVKETNEIVNKDCGNCNICVKSCPAGAIYGVNYKEGLTREDLLSAEKCSNNMKNYKDIGRGAVCGICIKVCPYNNLK